jgi:asparagine synthase (glutamine-hydrolysing)
LLSEGAPAPAINYPAAIARSPDLLGQRVSGPLFGFTRDILLDQRARARGWFDAKRVEALLGHNGRAPSRDGQSVWTLLCLELWAREFLD